MKTCSSVLQLYVCPDFKMPFMLDIQNEKLGFSLIRVRNGISLYS